MRFAEFGKRFQVQAPVYFTPRSLAKAEVDAFIVGSDWVWHFNSPKPEIAYFGYIKTDKPIYSYAASFGITPRTEPQFAFVKDFVKNFANISCREQEGVDLLKSLGAASAHRDVDPTLLVDGKEWEEVAVEPSEENFIVLYWLPSDDEDRMCRYVARCRERFPDCSVVVLNPNAVSLDNCLLKTDIGPQDFLGYIRKARYVITNSFHGCVFCCHFRTPFTVFPRFKGDFRIQNLLNAAGLRNRLFAADDMRDPADIAINWPEVNDRLAEQADRSLTYLKNVLTAHETASTDQ